MQKIAVVGSSYFEKYVEQIKTADMFPQVELFFIPDNGAPANIDINFVLNLIEEKAILFRACTPRQRPRQVELQGQHTRQKTLRRGWT